MGAALAVAFGREIPNTQIVAYDPDSERLQSFVDTVPGANAAAANAELAAGADAADVLILAVKPQVLPSVLPEIAATEALVVSIAAGVPLDVLESGLPAARVVRVMPNTPSLIGMMAGAYACGTAVTEADRTTVAQLLGTAGSVFELDEPLLDVVTGLSGSGPAFVARLIEAFADAGHAAGLPRDVADELARATFEGTAALLRERGMTPEELVSMVSSRGGTTVAGRAVLEQSTMSAIVGETIAAAAERSRELGGAGGSPS